MISLSDETPHNDRSSPPPYRLCVDEQWFSLFEQRLRLDTWDEERAYTAACHIDRLRCFQTDAPLACLAHLTTFSPLPHQIETAHRVIHELHGCALLADEVGLGKTIEAGLILKEYVLHGIVSRALLLVPASLVMQWVHELRSKFCLPAQALHRKRPQWDSAPILVASLDTAKREPHRSLIVAQPYDLLLIDEAHKLKNDRTANYAFIETIERTRCLLLTATPMHNDASELLHLLHLIHPGLFDPHTDRRSLRHMFRSTQPSSSRPISRHNDPTIHEAWHTIRERLSQRMIRNRREDAPMPLPQKRHVQTVLLTMTPPERALYDQLPVLLEKIPERAHPFTLLTLQRQACSSYDAVLIGASRWLPTVATTDLDFVHNFIRNSRTEEIGCKPTALLSLLQKNRVKTIVFTTYRATQQFLVAFLSAHGWSALPYDGSMKKGKKSWMIEQFQKHATVLVATDAGSEGLNLQFCQQLVNYDLPWNPMRLEQRIGRIDRLGQTADIHVINFVIAHTLEERILHVLQKKLSQFQHIIGDILPLLTDPPNVPPRTVVPAPEHQQTITTFPSNNTEVLRSFIRTFATLTHCPIVSDQPHAIHIQLSAPIDQQLTDRPFYWRMIEATGQPPEPLHLLWHTDPLPAVPPRTLPERLHYGSDRLMRLLNLLCSSGRCLRLFAQHATHPLRPWLVVHWNISKKTHVTTHMLRSWAVCLSDGTLSIDWQPPSTTWGVQPLPGATLQTAHMDILTAWKTIKAAVIRSIHQMDSAWASEARTTLAVLIQQLHAYFSTKRPAPEDEPNHIIRMKELHDRLLPRMHATAVRGGLFYV